MQRKTLLHLDGLIFAAALAAPLVAQENPGIGWANVQWPPATNHVVSATNRTPLIFGQVWIDGVTSKPGASPDLRAQLGFGPAGSNPRLSTNWVWVEAAFNLDSGNNDEFMAALLPEKPGTYDYVYRYAAKPGGEWLLADLKGPVPAGETPASPGKLTVEAGADRTPPAVPAGLVVAATATNLVTLSWKSNDDDPTLFGYEVLRSGTSGGPYTNAARVTTNTFTDKSVTRGETYYYVVRAIDQAFNRSGKSSETTAAAEPSTSITFNVTVPPETSKPVYLAGTLAMLNGGLLDWDPGWVPLNKVDATHWTITLSGKQGAELKYKYTLGSWDNVEKGETCDEITDREAALKANASGPQLLNDKVVHWRNIAPCGD